MSNKNRFVSALFTSLLLRGHGNGQDADFTQLLKCRSEDDPAFSEWLNRKNQNATLREIQNEILKEMSLSILRIIDELKHRTYQIKSRLFFVFVGIMKTFFHMRIFSDCMK